MIFIIPGGVNGAELNGVPEKWTGAGKEKQKQIDAVKNDGGPTQCHPGKYDFEI
jgi:hypothetical protein